MSKRLSQTKRILAYLETGKSLTCEECRDMNCGANLSQRISNLRNDEGINVSSKEVSHTGGYHAVYSLPDSYFIEQIEKISEKRLFEIAYIFKDIGTQYKFDFEGEREFLLKVFNDIKNNSFVAVSF